MNRLPQIRVKKGTPDEFWRAVARQLILHGYEDADLELDLIFYDAGTRLPVYCLQDDAEAHAHIQFLIDDYAVKIAKPPPQVMNNLFASRTLIDMLSARERLQIAAERG